MSLFRSLISTIVEALFPLSAAEQALLHFTPAEAYAQLLKAPPSPVPQALSLFAYKDERVSKLIWHIKYKKTPRAVEIGGYALFQALINYRNKTPATSVTPRFVLIPIPITSRRRRERGFNQCEIVVDEISRLDSDHLFTIKKDLLIRSQHTSRQTLKGREERLESAKGIFEVNQLGLTQFLNQLKSENFENTIFIVIDDVITTGSTLQEAMNCLRNAGLPEVCGLSLAH